MSLQSTLSSLLQGLVFPPGAMLAGAVLGGIAAWRGYRRIGFVLFAAPVALTLALALPWVSDRIVAPLEERALAAAQAARASGLLPRVAVVLGGALGPAGPDARAASVGYDLNKAADRVVAGARLYREGQVDRLVFSGGSDDATAEAELMARFAGDLGVPRTAMLLETASRNTRENAAFVAKVLRDHRLGPDVTLVTSAMHVRRAIAQFRCAGLSPVPVPAEYEVLGARRRYPGDLFPDLGALDRGRRGLKEWAGSWVGGCG